jgi:NAD(P)H-quinone oxidoreductase subunit 5
MNMFFIESLAKIDGLAKIAIFLIIFIGLVVALFSLQYMKGDLKYKRFFATFFLIIAAVIITVSANNIFVFLASWAISNIILIVMMVHKSSWNAALQSGKIAAKNFALGFCFLALGLYLLQSQSNQVLIEDILAFKYQDTTKVVIALLLILLAAMTQSAIYPFNSWIKNSLNSPTPVSALMHAGLVNGGGILLARFAPLYFNFPKILTLIFVIGFLSAIIGTFWKLIQNSVKNMLAFSTIGQMGFMFVECGLGLFSAAIAHLFWHGCFKSYLFLTSNGAAKEKKFDLAYPPSLVSFGAALICAIFGLASFSFIADKNLFVIDSSLVLTTLIFIAASHFALNIVSKNAVKNFVVAIIFTTIAGALYGSSLHIIENQLSLSNLHQAQELNIFHIIAIAVFIALWLGRLFWHKRSKAVNDFMAETYVKALNYSQPDCKATTSNRNEYKLF